MTEHLGTNAVVDVGSLLKLPTKVLNELFSKINLCIGSIISEAKANHEQAVSINIGIGLLGIDLKTMQCKFSPNKDLKKIIKSAITDGIDPLELTLEQELANKLLSICDEVM